MRELNIGDRVKYNNTLHTINKVTPKQAHAEDLKFVRQFEHDVMLLNSEETAEYVVERKRIPLTTLKNGNQRKF
jgi:hypothetical protein